MLVANIMKAKTIVTLYIKNVTGALYTVHYNESTLSVFIAWRLLVHQRQPIDHQTGDGGGWSTDVGCSEYVQ